MPGLLELSRTVATAGAVVGLSLLLSGTSFAGSVKNSTSIEYYDVIGTSYTELLTSMLQNAPRHDGSIALGLLETRPQVNIVPTKGNICKLKDISSG